MLQIKLCLEAEELCNKFMHVLVPIQAETWKEDVLRKVFIMPHSGMLTINHFYKFFFFSLTLFCFYFDTYKLDQKPKLMLQISRDVEVEMFYNQVMNVLVPFLSPLSAKHQKFKAPLCMS